METYGRLFIIVTLLSLTALPTYSQQYSLNTYADESEGNLRDIKTLFIDLDTKSVVLQITYGYGGLIVNKSPIKISRGSLYYLINAANEGCFCKNASSDQAYQTRITIINPQTQSIERTFADSGMAFIYFQQGQNGSAFVDGESTEGLDRHLHGDYILNSNFELRLQTPRPGSYNPKLVHGIGEYTILVPISVSRNLYLSWSSERRFVFKLNDNLDAIIDSLRLVNSPQRTHIIGLNHGLLYVFNQNYEFYGETIWKGPDDDRIESHLLIYDSNDFSLVDSLSIPDYPLGEYIGGEFGVADVIGPYIVYYYFIGDGIQQFAPAMLFIFDTRTNEASWLRVGWR